MSFINFLSASLRLVDLIDSKHAIGGSYVANVNEDRTGDSKGYWLDLAIHLLEFLREQEININRSYVHLDDYYYHIKSRHPGVCMNDILYVASILCSPTVFEFINPDESLPIPQSTKETNLLERSKTKTGYRLSKHGRECLSLSDGFQALIYAEQDANKICVAIDRSRFEDALRFCKEISSRLRTYAIEISKSLERPDRESILLDFMEHHKGYLESIDNVQVSAKEARHKLSNETVMTVMDEIYGEESEIKRQILIGSTRKLLQTVERLGRKMTELLIAVQTKDTTSIGIESYDKVAARFALSLCGSVAIERISEMTGPWFCNLQYMSPSDTSKYFKDAIISQPKESFSFSTEITEMPDEISNLFKEHYKEISKRLKDGPLPLTEALEKGWLYLDDGCEGLTNLLGVYNSPDWLEVDGDTIHICRSGYALKHQFNSGKRVYGDDLLLVMSNQEVLDGSL